MHRGKIVGERYAPGWTKDTPQISWSAGKSITAALVGIIVQARRSLKVDDVAPMKEWRTSKEDPRREIRVRDLLRMSSGLDFANLGLNGPESFTRDNKHMRIYFDGLNVFEHAVNQPQEIRAEHAVALSQQRSAHARPHRQGERSRRGAKTT